MAPFAAGQLDPRARITLAAAGRTPGPTGFSLFRDDLEASLRDLVVAMLTISDNVATDALLSWIGIDTVNAASARLGLASTIIATDVRTCVDSIGHLTPTTRSRGAMAALAAVTQTAFLHGAWVAADTLGSGCGLYR